MKLVLSCLGALSLATMVIGGANSAEQLGYIGASLGQTATSYDFDFINPRTTTAQSKNNNEDELVATFKIGRHIGLGGLTNNTRVEFEYGYIDTLVYTAIFNPFTTVQQKVETKSRRIMLNVAHDFEIADKIKVFPIVGIGWSSNTTDGFQTPSLGAGTPSNFSEKETDNLAWSVGAGLSYSVSNKVVFDLSYQYLDLGTAKTGPSEFAPFDENFEGDLVTHEVKLGIRYSF